MKNRYYFQSFLFIFRHAKFWLVASVIFAIVTGLFPVVTVWITKEVVNTISLILQNQFPISKTLIGLLVLQLIVMASQKIIGNIQSYINAKYEKVLDFELEKVISEKSSTSPLSYFENTVFHNHLDRIQFNKGARLMTPVSATISICRDIITLISLFAFLLQYHWLLIMIVMIIVGPIIYIHMKYGKKEFELHVEQTPKTREQFYLNALLNNRVSASEIRLFNLKDFFIDRWAKLFKEVNYEYLKLVKSKEIASANINILSVFLYFVISIFLVFLSRNRLLQIGDFVSILQTVQTTEGSLVNISTNIGSIYSENLYIKDLFDFLDFEDTNYSGSKLKRSEPFVFQKSIEFINVSFKYPYSDQLALDNVSFKINKGEKIAVVGENGSGKTTLVNCLMGLYPISKGEVLIDGININDVVLEDIHENITVIFQDFMKYNFSLEKNITLNTVTDEAKLNFVSLKSGVDKFVKNLNQGYKTILGKVFLEGEDLSEGQWQKIAISRALYKGGDIFVLDEPTSALDPKAEIEIYNQFDSLVKDKTSIFISHRMASTKMADKIFVFANGRLVEEGTHLHLMQLNNTYAEMYGLQADWYK